MLIEFACVLHDLLTFSGRFSDEGQLHTVLLLIAANSIVAMAFVAYTIIAIVVAECKPFEDFAVVAAEFVLRC